MNDIGTAAGHVQLKTFQAADAGHDRSDSIAAAQHMRLHNHSIYGRALMLDTMRSLYALTSPKYLVTVPSPHTHSCSEYQPVSQSAADIDKETYLRGNFRDEALVVRN